MSITIEQANHEWYCENSQVLENFSLEKIFDKAKNLKCCKCGYSDESGNGDFIDGKFYCENCLELNNEKPELFTKEEIEEEIKENLDREQIIQFEYLNQKEKFEKYNEINLI